MTEAETLKAELRALEERLLDADVRRDPAEVGALLAPEFVEFGASGRVFDRAAIVASLLAEGAPARRRISRVALRELAPGVALLTCRVTRDDGQQTLRSSLWQQREGRWQMVFHQGTLAAADDEGTL
jgi:hypothetical protein